MQWPLNVKLPTKNRNIESRMNVVPQNCIYYVQVKINFAGKHKSINMINTISQQYETQKAPSRAPSTKSYVQN